MSTRLAGPLVWLGVAAGCAALTLTTVLAFNAPSPLAGLGPQGPSDVIFGFAVLGFLAVGALLVSRRPENTVGWMLWGFGVASIATIASGDYAYYALARDGGSPLVGGAVAAWLSSWLWAGMIGFLALAVLLFPDGRLPSRRWRWAAWIIGAGLTTMCVAGLAMWPYRGLDLLVASNQEDFPGLAGVLSSAALPLLFGGFVAAAASVVVRFMRSCGDEREQLKWLAYAGAVVALSLLGTTASDLLLDGQEPAIVSLLAAAGVFAIPVAVGIAVMKYRLYDIDRLISRTLSYALLSAILAAVYAGGVIGARALLAPLTVDAQWAVAASTLVAAAAFGPLRRRVQDGVDRRFNRARYDATLTVQQFSARLRDELELDGLLAQLQAVAGQAVQPAHVSLWLRRREAGRG